MKRAMLSLIACAALTPLSAAAQDEWVRQVRAQLSAAGSELTSRGYQLTHEVYTGSLGAAQSTDIEFSLSGGKQYMIMGACDTDCSDLDLRIFDAGNVELDVDLESDDVPLVQVTPLKGGTFRLRVIMATCTAAPCRYGIGVWGK